MMVGIIAVTMAAFAATCAYWIWTYRPGKDFPPGPAMILPFLGTWSWNGAGRQSKIEELVMAYGSVMSLSLQYVSSCILVSDYEIFAKDIKGNASTFANRPKVSFAEIFGMHKGIGLSNGAHWLATRRLALKAMRESGMGKRSLAEDIAVEADSVVSQIEKCIETNGGRFEPGLSIVHAVSNVVATVVFGHRWEQDSKAFQLIMKFVESNTLMVDNFTLRCLNSYGGVLKYVPKSWMLASKEMREIHEFKAVVDKEVELCQAKLDPAAPSCVLDLYLIERDSENSNPYLKDEETLVASVLDLFGAGSDTTANTIRWALKFLAKYPHIQEDVYQEIMQQVGHSAVPDHTKMGKMPLLSATIFEVMRFTTLVPVGVEHSTTKPVSVGGYNIPAGTTIFLHLKAIHEDPRYWKDAHNFNPANFLDSDGRLHVPQQFMPFGFGSRVCIGQPLAKMELLVFLTRILQRFQMSFPEGEEVDMDPQPGADLIVRPSTQDIVFTFRSRSEE